MIITSTFHTAGDYVVLAEADSPVGADVERVTDIGIDDGLKNIALTERERFRVKDSLLSFFVVWTRKESLIKREGSEFCSEPCEIDALHDNNFDDPVNYKGIFYRIESFMLDGQYQQQY